MKLCPSLCCIAVAGALLVAALPQDAGKPAPRPAGEPGAQDAPEMAMPDMSLMMPNEHHKKLAALAGTWTINGKMVMPGAPPMEFSGQSEVKSVMGGRYLVEQIKGDPSPMGVFEGMGVAGYDNRTKKYQMVWFDNMGTAIMSYEGDDDPETGHIVWHGDAPNMMTGAMEKSRSTGQKQADGSWQMKEYRTPAGGSEALAMEMTYKPAGR